MAVVVIGLVALNAISSAREAKQRAVTVAKLQKWASDMNGIWVSGGIYTDPITGFGNLAACDMLQIGNGQVTISRATASFHTADRGNGETWNAPNDFTWSDNPQTVPITVQKDGTLFWEVNEGAYVGLHEYRARLERCGLVVDGKPSPKYWAMEASIDEKKMFKCFKPPKTSIDVQAAASNGKMLADGEMPLFMDDE